MPIVFDNPWFLTGLLALGVPVVLHLMQRQQPRRVVFPSIRFIRKGHQPQHGRRGLRDLLTLLMRLALLALVVLLFAGPRRRVQTGAGGDAVADVALLYDVSASMNAGDFPAFVTRETDDILDRHDGARAAALVSGEGVDKILPLGTPPGEVRALAATLRPGVRPGDHRAAVEALAGMLRPAPAPPTDVYVLTDRQARDWGGLDVAAMLPNSTVHYVTPDWPLANVAIAGVVPETFVAGDTRRLRATVRLRNYDLEPAQREVVLRAGDRETRKTVEIGAEASAATVLDLSNPAGHEAVATLEPGDAYGLDDTWHAYIGRRPPVRVAIVLPPDDADARLQTFFLERALAVTLPGVERFDVEIVGPDFLVMGDPAAYGAVFLLDGVELGTVEREALAGLVDDGLCLVVVGGDRSPETLSRLREGGVLDTRFLGFSGSEGQRRSTSVAGIDSAAGVMRIFAEEPGDLFVFPVHRHARLAPAPGARVLATLGDRSPLLIREEHGRGSVYILAVALLPGWSELPMSVSFVPLVRRLLEYRAGARDRGVIAVESGLDPAAVAAANRLPAVAALGSEPGVYQVGDAVIEVNHTRAESDLARVDTVTSGQALAVDSGRSTGPASLGPSYRPRLAGLLLLFVFLELLAANWPTRSRPAATE